MAAFHDDDGRRRGLPGWFFVLCLVGGAFFFFRYFGVAGLDQVSIYQKERPNQDQEFISYNESSVLGATGRFVGSSEVVLASTDNPFDEAKKVAESVVPRRRVRNLRIASWALDGFTPSKLANPTARLNLMRVIRQFDIIALQQIASIERDIVPRLADAANEAGRNYDYIIGEQTGPADRSEQLAFIFDVNRVKTDRRQTYTVADPDNQMLYDPMVAWFSAAEPPANQAWTFSVVNVRIDLSRAVQEVTLLPNIMSAVRMDGRGEDDVVMAGLFQADDEYLLPTIAGEATRAAVRSVPTDIFGRHQTANILMDTKMTSEYIGRGGAFDFLRVYNLSAAEAETISSHLPVFAEFTATEGGEL